MKYGEKTLKKIIEEVLAEIGETGCNTPIAKPNVTLAGSPGVAEPSIPGWTVVFSCNALDPDKRRSVKFEVETPDERNEAEIKEEILAKIKRQLT